MQHDAEHLLLNGNSSPTPTSIYNLEQPEDISQPRVNGSHKHQLVSSQILPDYFTNSLTQKSGRRSGSHTRGSSRKNNNKAAAQRYREKKKAYAKILEDNIDTLQQEIKTCDQELSETKSKLVNLLSVSKTNNEHSETYAELAICVASEGPDLDKINLLLDTLKYRIGANGRQRQAKIDYFFKQIINTIFPALHRYLMHCAKNKVDIFSYQTSRKLMSSYQIEWAQQIYKKMQPSSEQLNTINTHFANKFVRISEETKKEIIQLQILKRQLKDDQQVVENIVDHLRKSMHPVQSARWILYCERHKYREEVSLQMEFQELQTGIESRKRVKKQQG